MSDNNENLSLIEIFEDYCAEYSLHEMSDEATLLLLPDKLARKIYSDSINAQIKGKRLSNMEKKGRIAAAKKLKKMPGIMADRKIFPEYVVIGWRGIKNENGDFVDYSVSECRELLKAMPDWMFDKIRLFVSNTDNFPRTFQQ